MQALDAAIRCLKAIRDYEPMEVVIDKFAYERMVENYREAARNGLAEIKEAGSPCDYCTAHICNCPSSLEFEVD